jgi:hypothetical protein
MRIKFVLLVAPICMLGACAIEPRRFDPPVVPVIVQPAPPSDADRLLTYMMQTRKLEARDFATERDQMRNTFQTEKSDFNRVKLAILLTSIPASLAPPTAAANASATEDTELIGLLEPLVSNASAAAPATAQEISTAEQKSDVRAMAMLIYSMAQDRKKLRDQWREALTRLNTARRDDSKEAENRALRARVEELERNLAALKSIDRSVNRRSENQRVEPPRAVPPK